MEVAQEAASRSDGAQHSRYVYHGQKAFELSSVHMPAEIASSQVRYLEHEIPSYHANNQ
jgi:hypothetical protein